MKNIPKVLLFGCCEGIAKSLDILMREKKVFVMGVIPTVDKYGKLFRSEQLIKKAHLSKVKIFYEKNVNDQKFITYVKKNKIELLCNWGHGQLFSKNLIGSAIIGSLNLHPGLLPYGRGSGAIQGEIWNNAQKIGQTCHLMDENFDMGVVVHQREFKITGYEYLDEIENKLKKDSAQFFVEAIYKCLDGNYKNERLHKFGRYFPKIARGDTIIDWNNDSDFIVRKVRSRSPYLLSRSFLAGEQKEFFIRKISHSYIDNYLFVPGQVIDKNHGKGVLVKTKDNAVWLEEITFDGKKFFVPKFKIGTCFVANPLVETVYLHEVFNDVLQRLNFLESGLRSSKNTRQ